MATPPRSDSFRQLMCYLVFPAASALGFYGTVKLARDNGLTDSMIETVRQSPSHLPGLRGTHIKQWTGLAPIDKYFSFFVTFFWPVITSSNDKVQLQSRHFIGQFVAMWTLLELEGIRSGDFLSLLSGTLLTGLAIQNVGAATTVPIYAALQLLRGRKARKAARSDDGIEESQRLRAIPIAMALGVLTPLAVMSFSKSPNLKQLGIVVFQIYPIFTSLIIRLVAPLIPREEVVKRKAGDSLPGPLSAVYIFSTVVATLSHIVTLSEALSKGIPLLDLFLPRLGLSQPGDMTEAGLNFLRWDEAVSCGSLLVWAIARYVLDTAPTGGISTTVGLHAAAGALVRTVLMGPVGAAAELLRQREISKL